MEASFEAFVACVRLALLNRLLRVASSGRPLEVMLAAILDPRAVCHAAFIIRAGRMSGAGTGDRLSFWTRYRSGAARFTAGRHFYVEMSNVSGNLDPLLLLSTPDVYSEELLEEMRAELEQRVAAGDDWVWRCAKFCWPIF